MTAPNAIHSPRLVLELASRDIVFDAKVSLCIVASLVAVIAPLLLLFGLKHGVVSQLQQNLLNDPRNLEIRLVGNHNLSPDWIERLRQQPQAGFVAPLTRTLNTQVDLVVDRQRFIVNAEVLPSASGDPLLPTGISAPENNQSVVLSAAAARQLSLNQDSRVNLVIQRKLNNQIERAQLSVTVTGVLAPEAFSRPAVLVPLEVLLAIEDFKDGNQVPLFATQTGNLSPQHQRSFARVRLYANQLDDVEPLSHWLEQQQIETVTQLTSINAAKAIDQVLSLIFNVIAWTAALGAIASLFGAFLANIERKRKDLALLRLLGFHRIAVGIYVIVQALVLTTLAFALGLGLYFTGAAIFNQALSIHLTEDSFICRLEYHHAALAFISALGIAITVATIGGLRAISIQPAESLRHL